MAINVPILVAILIFYGLIFVVGIWAARMTRKRKSASQSETLMVGAKDLGVFVGVCTLAATWYGGVSINGTAEVVYDPSQGLVWAVGLPGAAASTIANGLFFVKAMRDARYLTTLDPFEAKFGKYSTIIFFLNESAGGILYIAAILNALGSTLEVVAGMPRLLSVIVSAVISVLYTIVGGLYSVAYTDVIQLVVILLGLILAIPFALTNEAVSSISDTAYGPGGWTGTLSPDAIGSYVDLWISLIFGGIPLQVVYQRAFAVKTTRNAQLLCVIGGLVSAFLVLPPALIGAAGASTNWSMTGYMNGSGVTPLEQGGARLILPAVLQYLTPTAVAFFGLGAVSAGVMSSMDSSLLAVGTLCGRNIWKKLLREKASEKEVVLVIRITILVVALAATGIAVSSGSIMTLFYLCADFTFIVTFPQFASILFLDPNMYGSIAALTIAIVLRIGGGDYLLGLEAPFNYVGGTNFPVKTVCMLSSFLTLNVISYLAKILFEKGWIPEKYDVLKSNLAHGGRTIYLENINPNEPRQGKFKDIPITTSNDYVQGRNERET